MILKYFERISQRHHYTKGRNVWDGIRLTKISSAKRYIRELLYHLKSYCHSLCMVYIYTYLLCKRSKVYYLANTKTLIN